MCVGGGGRGGGCVAGRGRAGPGQASSNQDSPAGFAAPNKRLTLSFLVKGRTG